MEGSRAGEVREFGGIEMVWCPPGEFLMGSPEDEAGRSEDETQHRVTLTRGFWMAKTETTQGQWESVAGDNPSEFTGEERPVETVSWDDVQGWLEKMNERHPLAAGWRWELPTEAQWEYACRAGTETAFAGRGVLDEMGWYGGNIRVKTDSVGGKKANAWSLHDMHGNLSEWCWDRYEDYPRGSATDPTGPTTGSIHVHRGGCWFDRAALCRSALRSGRSPGYRSSRLGFRPALSSSGPVGPGEPPGTTAK
jgi:formylglycine-generating enzyme required for sulfatase activity